MMMRTNLVGMLLLSLFTVSFVSCNDDDDDKQPLKLESYQSEINFGETKHIAITDWEGDKSKITSIVEDEKLIFAEIVESKEDGVDEGFPYLKILGTGNGESAVIVKDEKGNIATIKVKAIDELAGFKAENTVQLLLNDDTYNINLKEGDFYGGSYTFGRAGDIVTFKWINEGNGKSASLTFTETSDQTDFSFAVHTDAVLTLINPDAEKEADKEIVIKLPYLKAIATQGILKQPEGEGVSEYITEKVWIIFRLPAKEGQEKGTMGFCIGAVTNN